MTIIDLSHTLTSDTPVYPGEPQPQIEQVCDYDTHGCKTTSLRFNSHTGTHVDCPAHFYNSGFTCDNADLSHFYGTATVIDCSSKKEGETITMEDIVLKTTKIKTLDFVLVHTGWSEKWNDKSYFGNFPVLSYEVCAWLTEVGIKGIGLDTISLDPINASEFSSHKLVLRKGLIIIENLCKLNQLINKQFTFSCFPLKIIKGDGSPVRAVAIMEQD